MNDRHSPEWLVSRVSAARDLVLKRLAAAPPEAEEQREMATALAELDLMWQELQAQAALLVRENARYAEFFEYAPDAWLVTDVSGGIREANQAALELLQAPREQIVGQALSQFTANFRLGDAAKPCAWRAVVQPQQGMAFGAEFSVRVIPLKENGVSGLCWRIRRTG